MGHIISMVMILIQSLITEDRTGHQLHPSNSCTRYAAFTRPARRWSIKRFLRLCRKAERRLLVSLFRVAKQVCTSLRSPFLDLHYS